MTPNGPNEPEILRELRLAKEYWLFRIHPHIVGRILSGVALFVANNAYRRLHRAQSAAKVWINSTDGKPYPVPADLLSELDGERFHAPEAAYADDNLQPETLAAIAAPMVNESKSRLAPSDAVRGAHELLRAAKRYVAALPKRKEAIERMEDELDDSNYVTFAEILSSNVGDSSLLPLLPPEPPGRNEGKLTPTAIKAAVRSFLEECRPRMTQEQVHDAMIAERLAWIHLCELRWERYKTFCGQQKTRAQNRKLSVSIKTTSKKPGTAKATQITSAAKSPLTAGKREK